MLSLAYPFAIINNIGEWRKLKPEQESEIIHILVDKTPDQLKFKDCMWSRENVGELSYSLWPGGRGR